MADGKAIDRATARGGIDVGLTRLRHAKFIRGNQGSSKRNLIFYRLDLLSVLIHGHPWPNQFQTTKPAHFSTPPTGTPLPASRFPAMLPPGNISGCERANKALF
jgi:hypothetical protein